MKDNDEKDLEIIANRKRFVHELRTTQEMQGRGRFYRPENRTYCALGIYHYFVIGRQETLSPSINSLGLSGLAIGAIMAWNDSGSSFAEIADKFEEANFPICRTIDATPYVLPIGPELLQQLNELVDATTSATNVSMKKEDGRNILRNVDTLKVMKTPMMLGIKQWEYDALLKVRNRLIEGDLKHIPLDDRSEWIRRRGFNMANCGRDSEKAGGECNTVACIGGWMALTRGVGTKLYVERTKSMNLHNLFNPPGDVVAMHDVTVDHAIAAINNFLYDGDPNWKGVLSPLPAEAGRITLVQWFEKYSGGSEGIEDRLTATQKKA